MYWYIIYVLMCSDILTVRVLDALTLNLEQKSRTYESPVLASVFLLNNYFFIQATFTRYIYIYIYIYI